MENFGERLRRLRGNQTQKEVARALNIPQTTLSTLENQPGIPRGEVLERLAAYFRVPVAYFYPQRSEPSVASERAKDFVRSLRQDSPEARDTIATHASPDEVFDDETKQLIAEKIEHLAKPQNK